MTTFRDVQEAFRGQQTSDFRCIATNTRGPAKGRCTEHLTGAQKDTLAEFLHMDKHQLHLDDVRAIIWELLCTDHRAQKSQYAFEKQVELQWRQEFPDLDFTARRNSRRKSGLSNPSTPTPRKLSSNGSFPQLSPSPSPLLQHDSDPEPGTVSQPRSALGAEGENIVSSIESPSYQSIPTGETKLSEDIVPSACPEEGKGASQEAGFDFENGVIDERWGDSSAAVGGRVSSRRRLQFYHLDNGKVKKELSEQVTTPREHAESQNESSEGSKSFELRATISPPDHFESTPTRDDRCSLSPEHDRRFSRNSRSRSRSRGSRSPSTPPVTDRGKLAFASMEGDAMYDHHPRDNEEMVVKLLHKSLAYTDKQTSKKPGWVYAIRDPELDLVKIGFTTERLKRRIPAEERFGDLRRNCHLSPAAYIVEDDKQVPILAFRRLEELVHADLRPHRWYYECACGIKKGMSHNTEHHEWYEITNDVAIRTINLWRNFLRQDPYGDLQPDQHHPLQDTWLQRFKNYPTADQDDKHGDHQKRINRWKSILQSTSPQRTEPLSLLPSRALATGHTSEELQTIKAEQQDVPGLSLEDIPPSAPEGPYNSTSQARPLVHLNDEHLSFPTTPIQSTASVTRSDSEGFNEIRRPSESFPAELLQQAPEGTSQLPSPPQVTNPAVNDKQAVSGISIHDFAESKFVMANVLGRLDAFLREERKGLSSRTAYNDLYNFRWPFSTAVTLALCSSYMPPLLSAAMWVLFLPCFVAELREWR